MEVSAKGAKILTRKIRGSHAVLRGSAVAGGGAGPARGKRPISSVVCTIVSRKQNGEVLLVSVSSYGEKMESFV